jgi:hypothetical protein
VEKAAQTIGVKAMMVPITAGILSALRRVLARRVSLKVGQLLLSSLSNPPFRALSMHHHFIYRN